MFEQMDDSRGGGWRCVHDVIYDIEKICFLEYWYGLLERTCFAVALSSGCRSLGFFTGNVLHFTQFY